MGYYQDMLERRRYVASKLYEIAKPRLEYWTTLRIGDETNVDMPIKDLVALTRYAMELDIEVAQLCREDSLDEEHGDRDERLAEAERLLKSVTGIRKEPGQS